MNITELMRTGHVKRWHIVRVAREQTIAEHMYRVWLICREIGGRLNLEHSRREKLETLALHHDIAEVKIGDIPTPTKKIIENETDALDLAELDAYKEYITFSRSVMQSDPLLILLLKMADLMEAVHFLEEEGIGKHAEQVKLLLAKQLAELHESTVWDEKYKHENVEAAWGVFKELCPPWINY